MDNFREMAESKMKEAVENQIQGEIDESENLLNEKEAEYRDLKDDGSRMEKRSGWLEAIAGNNPAGPGLMGGTSDPSALGARPSAFGAAGGRRDRQQLSSLAGSMPGAPTRQVRQPLGTPPSNLGGGGALGPNQSMLRPVHQPIAGPNPAGNLPQPVSPKVRQPITPIQPIEQDLTSQQPPSPLRPENEVKVQPSTPFNISNLAAEMEGTQKLESVLESGVEEDLISQHLKSIDEVVAELEPDMSDLVADSMMKNISSPSASTSVLRPVTTKILGPSKVSSKLPSSSSTLTPVSILQPKKRGTPPSSSTGRPTSSERGSPPSSGAGKPQSGRRGPPPSSGAGKPPAKTELKPVTKKPTTTILKPVTTLKPLIIASSEEE
jgi:hypothetical protein